MFVAVNINFIYKKYAMIIQILKVSLLIILYSIYICVINSIVFL